MILKKSLEKYMGLSKGNYRQQNVSAMAGFGVLITFGFFI
jgi:hypothetical protein